MLPPRTPFTIGQFRCDNYSANYGYLRVVVTHQQFRIEYHDAAAGLQSKPPSDTVTVNLATHTLNRLIWNAAARCRFAFSASARSQQRSPTLERDEAFSSLSHCSADLMPALFGARFAPLFPPTPPESPSIRFPSGSRNLEARPRASVSIHNRCQPARCPPSPAYSPASIWGAET